MAYSKTPVIDTHNTVRLPVTGSSFLTSNTQTTTPPGNVRFYNCYPVKNPQFADKPTYKTRVRIDYSTQYIVSTTPNASTNIGYGAISATSSDYIFFARQDTFYSVRYNSGSPTIGTVSAETNAYLATYTNAIDNTNTKKIVACIPGKICIWNEDGTGYATVSPANPPDYAKGIEFLNGYLFGVVQSGAGTKIYNSGVAGNLLTWNATDFIDAEMFADSILYLAKHHNHLVAFGSNSIEYFYDAGIEVGSPLTRQESYASRVGMLRPAYAWRSVARLDDDLYFFGKGDNQTTSVFRIREFKVEEVTTPYIRAALTQTQPDILSIETITVDQEPMVLVETTQDSFYVYYPASDAWWIMDKTNFRSVLSGGAGTQSRLSQMINPTTWNASGFGSSNPIYLQMNVGNSSTNVYIMSNIVSTAPTISAYYYTDPIDFDNSYDKHWIKVVPVGDFADANLYLDYTLGSNYTTWSSCGNVKSQAVGAPTQAAWYNICKGQKVTFRFTVETNKRVYVDALDITYNLKSR
jgi:hypothetical protein